jgi:MATE family multidrug resistance protein
MDDTISTNSLPLLRADIDNSSTVAPPPDSKTASYESLVWQLLLDSIPTMMYFMSIYAIFAGNIHFIGSLDNTYMFDGVGIATTLLNCTTVALIISLNNGMVSLAAQAFGANNKQLVGIYYHRALILNAIILCVDFVILIFSKWILLAIGIPEETAGFAAKYIFYCYIYLVEFVIFDTLKSYLLAQSIFMPQMIVQVTLCGLHWVWCYIFIDDLNWGLEGVAASMTITQGLACAGLYGYVILRKPTPETWFWFRPESYKEIWTLFKYEVPLASMIYLEWIAFEITMVFAASYTPTELGGMVAFLTVVSIFYNVPAGLSITLNTLTGKYVGAKDIKGVKRTLKAALGLMTIIAIIMDVLLYWGRDAVGEFFNSDSEVIDALDNVVTVYVFVLPIDCMQFLLGGYIRAIGRPEIGSVCFMVCYYLIGLPVAFILGNVVKLYDVGLWVGLGIAIYCLFVCFSVIALRSDLHKCIEQVEERINKDERSLSMQPRSSDKVEPEDEETREKRSLSMQVTTHHPVVVAVAENSKYQTMVETPEIVTTTTEIEQKVENRTQEHKLNEIDFTQSEPVQRNEDQMNEGDTTAVLKRDILSELDLTQSIAIQRNDNGENGNDMTMN